MKYDFACDSMGVRQRAWSARSGVLATMGVAWRYICEESARACVLRVRAPG